MTQPWRRTQAIQRFWSKVSLRCPWECWNWQRGLDKDGYGQTWFEGRDWKSHRLAFLLMIGVIPPALCVLHRCDNPRCCNPAHLFLGTLQDNIRDKVVKGRTRPGEQHPLAVLNHAEVVEIRASRLRGERYDSLGTRFGVSGAHIYNICRGKRWSHG